MNKKIFKTILITGASSGLGKALALEYAKEDVTLFLNGRNTERLTETARLCENKGAIVVFEAIDVCNKEELGNWILNCDKISKIDLIIANAGISLGTLNESNNCIYETYNIFDTNVYGVLNTILPIIPKMTERRNGQVVLISSMSGFIGMPSCPSYSSSKACVTAYGEGIRGLLKEHNVGVSIVCPGFIRTPLTDQNNFVMPMIMEAEKASKIIVKGVSKNKGMIAFPLIYYITLKFLRFLPFNWTNFILSKLPKKN